PVAFRLFLINLVGTVVIFYGQKCAVGANGFCRIFLKLCRPQAHVVSNLRVLVIKNIPSPPITCTL
ncbi:hypothetical protein, partial [Enterobacter asburiae]